jgi:hypothetical protein
MRAAKPPYIKYYKSCSQYIALLGLVLLSIAVHAKTSTISSLRLIGKYELPPSLVVNNTVIGGLSGLDYDQARKEWVIISDDKAQGGPVRFYRARMGYDLHGVHRVSIHKAVLLNDPYQRPYQDNTQLVPDAEAIRVDPYDGSIWWIGEGYIAQGGYPKIVKDPAIFHSSTKGQYLHTLPTLANLNASATEKQGPRHNKGLEGLSFSADGRTLWAAMEGPMFQDSQKSTMTQGAYSRITHFTRQGQVLAQYAYGLDPIPAQFSDAQDRLSAGVSAILALDANRLIVVERFFAVNQGAVIKLYEVKTDHASDIQAMPALNKQVFSPLQKRLLLTLDHTTYPNMDNIEGISWGHQLENGHDSLVLVSDNNFSSQQSIQFLVFEVIP